MGLSVKDFLSYLNLLIEGEKIILYEGAFAFFCIVMVALVILKGFREGIRCSAFLALIEYVILLYFSAVLCRTTRPAREYNWYPFWSYIAIDNGKSELFYENIMNIVAFIPVGLLLKIAFNKKKRWMVVLFGLCLSASIETLQYLFMKGFSELDDVMHNTLGCIIGSCLATCRVGQSAT